MKSSRPSPSHFVWALVSFAAGAGCATNPATGIAASGEPLQSWYATGTRTYTSNDVVATDVYRDANGNEIGSKERVEAVEHTAQWSDWRYLQGRTEVDEQDFYHLAGDDDAVARIASIRSSAALKMKIGAPIAIAGILASIVLTSIGKANGDASLTTIGAVGGGLVGSVGGLVWYWGAADMHQRHHLPASRADANANIVTDCAESRCSSHAGGRARRPPPPREAAEEAPPPSPAPEPPSPPRRHRRSR